MRHDILITEVIDGANTELAAFSIATVEAKDKLEVLKKEVENVKTRVQIITKLPRDFRDAVTLETRISGVVVFSLPAEVARAYSLIPAENA